MPFQKQVPMFNPKGYAGGWSGDNVYYAGALLAGPGGVIPGRAVSLVDTPNTTRPDAMNPQRVVNGGANAIGIALRARIGVIKDLKQESTDTIPEGYPVEVIMAGDVRVQDALPGSAIAVGTEAQYDTATGKVIVSAASAGDGSFTKAPLTGWYVFSDDSYDGDSMAKLSTFRKK